MSDPNDLAQFVKRTLDNADASGAKQAWIELVDHGGGDGGGLMTHDGKVMSMPDIAKAIADGERMHAQEHPEDAGRNVDGVVANQCLMATMGFADALSHAGVKYLAASPETMISPGTPTSVAEDIAANVGNPHQMAQAIVKDVMHASYGVGGFGQYSGAAAFDVLDLNAQKLAQADGAIKRFNDDASLAAQNSPSVRAGLRADEKSVPGMVRFPEATPDMPWHADRPAIAMYRAVAADTLLDPILRADANAAASAVGNLILAHKESGGFAPFDGSNYRDAVGPTIHAPVTRGQIDPWASHGISETDNAFYKDVDEGKLNGALA